MVRKKNAVVTIDEFQMFDERASDGRQVAQAIDRQTPIPHAVTIRAHRFDTFMTILTPKRFELLRLSKSGKRSIAELAAAANRDPSAVSKDVAKLVDLGLVHIVIESNAGHGVKKIVRPVAENIEISAAVL
nr:HTH domain-containing protein [uncultured Duganella sp.]